MNIQIHIGDQKLFLDKIHDFKELKKRLSTLIDGEIEEISYLDSEKDVISVCTETDLKAIDDLEQVIIQARASKRKFKVDKEVFNKYYRSKYTKQILIERLNKYEVALQENIEQEQSLNNIEQVIKRQVADIKTASAMIQKFKSYQDRQFSQGIMQALQANKFWEFIDKVERMNDFILSDPVTEISYQSELYSEIWKRINIVQDKFQSIYKKRTEQYHSNFTMIKTIQNRKVQLRNELHASKISLYQKQRLINLRRYRLTHQIQVTKSLLNRYI